MRLRPARDVDQNDDTAEFPPVSAGCAPASKPLCSQLSRESGAERDSVRSARAADEPPAESGASPQQLAAASRHIAQSIRRPPDDAGHSRFHSGISAEEPQAQEPTSTRRSSAISRSRPRRTVWWPRPSTRRSSCSDSEFSSRLFECMGGSFGAGKMFWIGMAAASGSGLDVLRIDLGDCRQGNSGDAVHRFAADHFRWLSTRCRAAARCVSPPHG